MTTETVTQVNEAQPVDALDKIISEAQVETPKQEAVQEEEQKEELWPKKAVNALAKAKGAAARERAIRQQYERELSDLRQAGQRQAPKTEQLKPQGMPKEDDFVGKPYGEYLAALNKWQVKEELREQSEAREQVKREQDIQSAQREEVAKTSAWKAERDSAIDANGLEAAKLFPDFADVVNKNQKALRSIEPHVKDALRTVKEPAIALYGLLLNGDIEELNAMTKEEAVEALVELRHEAKGLSQNKPVTRAPSPMKANTGTSATGGKRLDDYSPEEIRKWLK